MLKRCFFILLMLSGFAMTAQQRQSIQGKIIIPGDYSAEGIAVFNVNTGEGTISDAEGQFSVAVALDDELRFTSLIFQQFKVAIDEGVMEAGKLNLFLNGAVTELPEVVVSSNKLSGNIYMDVNLLDEKKTSVPAYDMAQVNISETYFAPDSLTGVVRNDAMAAGETYMVNGLNFVNLFKVILAESGRKKKNLPDREIDENVRKIYNDDFFRKNLDIKLENINDFIFYASDHGLTRDMLKKGNELDLISFLIEQSKSYKKLQAEN